MQKLKEKKPVARINVRIDPAIKARVTKAAHVLGKDITEFTVSTLDDKAREVLDRRREFELSDAEKTAFFEILDGNIPEPSEFSISAYRKYREMIEKGDLQV